MVRLAEPLHAGERHPARLHYLLLSLLSVDVGRCDVLPGTGQLDFVGPLFGTWLVQVSRPAAQGIEEINAGLKEMAKADKQV